MYKKIKISIAEQVVPFTEISGNRPVLFNTQTQTTEAEYRGYIEKFKKQFNFVEVVDGKYQYKRDSLIEATINIVSDDFPKFTYNYCIVELDDEILVYYITKIRPIQNNVNRLFLKLDTISTYYWKLPINTKVEVDRLNYSIKDNKKLLKQTLTQIDETIGDIIKDRKIVSRNKKNLTLTPYTYRNLTSNQIEKIKDFKHIPFQDGILLRYESPITYALEKNSNQILYSFLKPDDDLWLITTKDESHLVNYSSYHFLQIDEEKIQNHPKWWEWVLGVVSGWATVVIPILYSRAGVTTKITITYRVYCVTHEKNEIKQVVFYSTEKWSDISSWQSRTEEFKKNFTKSLVNTFNLYKDDNEKPESIVLLSASPESYDELSYKLPKIFNYIPPIKELVDFKLYSWTGTNLPFNYFNVNDNSKLNFKSYRFNTKYEDKHYISFDNGIESISNSPINNKYELSNMLSISQRVDSKTEYLAANSNQIEMEKKIARDDAILGSVKAGISIIGNVSKGIGKGLSGDIGGAVAGGAKAAGNVVDIASSIVNYQNKLAMINARIEDVGNKRSSYNGGETGDINLLSHENNTNLFDKNGMNVVIQLPSGELYNKLKFHYNKYGCKLNSYLSIKDCFDNTKHKDFTYIKFNDLSQLYLSTEIPQEALVWMNDLMISGIHFWKGHDSIALPHFEIPKPYVYKSDIEYFDGINEMKKTKEIII